MELRSVEKKQAPNLMRRPSSSTIRPETPQAEVSLQWVTARVPPDLVREIEAHAKGRRSATVTASPAGASRSCWERSRAFVSCSSFSVRRPSERSGSWPTGRLATGP